MLFRDATAADIPAVLPLVTAQYDLHTQWNPARFAVKPGFEQGYAHWLTGRVNNPRSVFLVAEVDHPGDSQGTIAAFLVATLETELPLYINTTYGFIHDLWVDETYRNEGIARQLVTLTLERFKAMGTTQVRCDTAAPNDIARALFTAAGFKPVITTMLAEI